MSEGDKELLEEVRAEYADSAAEQQPTEEESAPTVDAADVLGLNAGAETAQDAQSGEETAGEQPDAEQAGTPETGAENAEELPELEAMPGEAQEAQQDTQEAAHIPAHVLALMGVDSEEEALERITQQAVDKLVAEGAPEALAREVVMLRAKVGGVTGVMMSNRARDEPAAAKTDEGSAGQPADNGGAEKAQAVTPREVSPRLDRLARQADYIKQRTGLDMVEIIKNDPELLRGVGEYNEGRGGFDLMGAYNRYRMARTTDRAKVPATIGAGGGQKSGGRLDVTKLTDEQIDEIDRRVKAGERIVL